MGWEMPPKLPLPIRISGLPPNKWFSGSTRVHTPNDICMCSASFSTANRHRLRYVCSIRPHPCTGCVWWSVDESATALSLLPHHVHGTGCRQSCSCCGRPPLFIVCWKHFCSSLRTDTGKTGDCFMMCPRSSIGMQYKRLGHSYSCRW